MKRFCFFYEAMTIKTFYLKSMVCNSCIKTVRKLLEDYQIEIQKINLGEVTVILFNNQITEHQIEETFIENGFDILKNKDDILIEQIKIAIIELVHKSNYMNSIIRNSDYLVEKLGYSYQYLSAVFSKKENRTLENFIILHRIEKVKEMLSYKDLSLSEIAFEMGYSSVQYLSSQFKKITGVSVNEYKNADCKNRIVIEEI
jgi:YesN/AraC family two-component response regulator